MKRFLITGIAVAALTASMAATALEYCNPDISITKPDRIYSDHGDTVTDLETGLMWQKCSQGLEGSICSLGKAGTYTWPQALELAQLANAGAGTFGYTDWRLPSIAELHTLVEVACEDPALNPTIFPEQFTKTDSTQPDPWYWSSSPAAIYADSAWMINLQTGEEAVEMKNVYSFVRLVRGGN